MRAGKRGQVKNESKSPVQPASTNHFCVCVIIAAAGMSPWLSCAFQHNTGGEGNPIYHAKKAVAAASLCRVCSAHAM
ncbi:hypothetical protein NDU88_007871 [Pleurodeles waltl]|uniref:Uncharacterized protein n=1 Tax=Pleurodeles waltl TaxID=8319 RepID=A0AAV7RQN7_PLEWA|nr:hypothetical protein NDU88_007871 [Pleurodeles waltl]